MKSMTGHGRGNAAAGGWRCVAECASVNRKGIEIAVALPKPLAVLESRVREEVQRTVHRGRVNVSLAVEPAGTSPSKDSVIDREAARRALADLRALRDELRLPGEISLDLLLRSPASSAPPRRNPPIPSISGPSSGKRCNRPCAAWGR